MSQELSLRLGQIGLPYFPEYGLFGTFSLKKTPPKKSYEAFLNLAQVTDRYCASTDYQTVVIRGVAFPLWQAWGHELGWERPAGMGTTRLLAEYHPPFQESGGDLWFHVKSNEPSECKGLFEVIQQELGELVDEKQFTLAAKRPGGRVLGGRFTDALINPVDPVNLSARVMVGEEDPNHRGSCFAISQKFVHNWRRLRDMSELDKEDMIGRDEDDMLLAIEDDRSHIKCVRQLNEERINDRLMRQALPFGAEASNPGEEQGVYFAAYAKSSAVFDDLIQGMVGPEQGFIKDKLMNVSHSQAGNFWYVPSAKELQLPTAEGDFRIPLPEYFQVRSRNGLMFYNAKDFLYARGKQQDADDFPLSDRILHLLGDQFSRWHDGWYRKRQTPPLGHLRDHLDPDEAWILEAPVMLRKAKSVQLSLSKVLVSKSYSIKANLFLITPQEIIVGNMPQLSLGIGTQVMEYLHEDERLTAFFGNLNEYSATGHNVPDYAWVLAEGIGGLHAAYGKKMENAQDQQREFYQAVLWALEGLASFINAYADQAKRRAEELPKSEVKARENLIQIHHRLKRICWQKPEGFLDSLQLIFLINCALHQTGEPMSIGRLDQLLIDSYREDVAAGILDPASAQEIIDAFWLKMDETVLFDRKHLNDYLNYGTGAVFYSAGNFPQGAAINQWVQQLTVGGTVADNSDQPQDACNEVTMMCLRAARRLPMNAPCLSLRVHGQIGEEYLQEAAKALLSGGAHPVLLQDDKLIPALMESGPLQLADARDYASDGCYEPIIPGKTEWAFSYTPILPLVGMAMNQGATIEGAGPLHLRGLKQSWNSPPAEEIDSFEEFLEIFFTHWRWTINQFFNTLMNGYGDLAPVCPSPLFSSMVHDCLDTGRDMTDGGARYHIVAPMLCGITNTIDALYAVKKMVYDRNTAVTTLPEFLLCLQCNWGENMIEPFFNRLAGPERAAERAQRFKALRKTALQLPKFGQGQEPKLVELASQVVERCVAEVHRALQDPIPAIEEAYGKLKEKYGSKERPFAFTVTPGVGTFEDNVGLGVGMGASADGRLMGEPIADDFSPAPSPQDLPIQQDPRNIFEALQDWNLPAINFGLSNAAPVDLNIHEEFPQSELVEVLRRFAQGRLGSNLMTVTCGNTETFQGAARFPEKYDLVRVRMGGWSEFFSAMFPYHQQHIMRRPFFVAGKPAEVPEAAGRAKKAASRRIKPST
ncbi:MAG: Dyp-type peroxidase [Planctomycetota bacterium]|nr:MAG: Dyp-type peroxidase [Planctomycetota bacterium]